MPFPVAHQPPCPFEDYRVAFQGHQLVLSTVDTACQVPWTCVCRVLSAKPQRDLHSWLGKLHPADVCMSHILNFQVSHGKPTFTQTDAQTHKMLPDLGVNLARTDVFTDSACCELITKHHAAEKATTVIFTASLLEVHQIHTE